MSASDGLILVLPGREDAVPRWTRVVGGAVTQTGAGTGWLSACGLVELPAGDRVVLVVPPTLTALHWIAYPDMPAPQGRAAARLAALSESIGPADTLIAATDENDDPALPHVVAIAARADVQHWLLWAQHHGLDPDAIVPAALLLPAPEEGTLFRGEVAGEAVLRGPAIGIGADDPLADALVGEAEPRPVAAEAITASLVAALDDPPLNLRQGDFAKRRRREVDWRQLKRMAVWCGFIALISLTISIIAMVKLDADTRRLDEEALAAARTVAPGVADAESALTALDSKLAERGGGAWGFTGPVAALLQAMQGAPGVSLTTLARSADGTLNATLAATRAEEINTVLLAIQAAGFTITAASSQDPGGRTLANITVRP